MPNQGSVRLARIGLVKLDPTLEAPLELPAEEAAPLELPPETDSMPLHFSGELDEEVKTATYATGGFDPALEAEPPTNPYAKGFSVPNEANAPEDIGGTTTPYDAARFTMPIDAVPSNPAIITGSTTVPVTDFVLPPEAVPSGAAPIVSRDSVPFELPDDEPSFTPIVSRDSGVRLDLPDEAPSLPAPSAPRPRPSTPREARVTPLPSWLTDQLADSRVAASLCGGLVVVSLIDLLSAGRAELPAAIPAVHAGLGLTAAIAIALKHRAGIVFALGCVIAAVFATPLVLGSLAAWFVTVAATSWAPIPRRFRLTGAVAGVIALLVGALPVLDGFTARPLLGALDRSGSAIAWPFADQSNGLQLNDGPATLRSTNGLFPLFDPTEGTTYHALVLPRRSVPSSALSQTREWLTNEFRHLDWGEPATGLSGFDSLSYVNWSAERGRAKVKGLAQIFLVGDDAFAVTAVTREHRFERTEPTIRQVLAKLRYRAPKRPRLTPDAAEKARTAIMRSVDGQRVGVRVTLGANTLLLVNGAPSGTVEFVSSEGHVPVTLDGAKVIDGVAVVKLTAGAGLAPSAATNAPALTRVVVFGTNGWTSGWLSSAPSDDGKRPVELFDTKFGPALRTDGELLGFVTPGGQLVPTERFVPTWKALTGMEVALSPAPSSPAPLYEPRDATSVDLEVTGVPTTSVVLARSATGSAAATVIDSRPEHWILITDASLTPPGTEAVTIRFPSGTTRAAEPVRSALGVTLLVLPRFRDDELTTLPVSDGRSEGRRVTWGFRDDPATGTQTIKGAFGELTADDFALDPGPPVSSGPVMSPDGRVAAWRRAEGLPIVHGDTLQALSVPGIRDVVWRIAAEPSGTCQLAATVLLEDPLGVAKFVRVRKEPASEPLPTRLTVAAIADAVPEAGRATLLVRSECDRQPTVLQFEVQSDEGTRLSRVQRVPVVTTLPSVLRGRSGPSPGASAAPSSMVGELWSIPPPVTMNHACAKSPELCERACAVDDLDACTLDGREALSRREVPRAVAVLDQMCAKNELEACVVLGHALEQTKPPKSLVSHREALLQPWCDAGLVRACTALTPKDWKKRLATLKASCASTPHTCAAYARQLLIGPRLDADVTAALASFKTGCGTGDLEACADFAGEALRFGRLEPLAAMPALKKACEGGIARACVDAALDPALGLTEPKNDQAVEAMIRRACQLNDSAACAMTPAPAN